MFAYRLELESFTSSCLYEFSFVSMREILSDTFNKNIHNDLEQTLLLSLGNTYLARACL